MKLTTRKGFHIGQLAKLANVRPDTVRFYERDGLLARPERSPAGYRIYDEAALKRRFAEELFDRYLPTNACYVGLDVSSTMIELAQSRTARFGGRAAIQQTSGTTRVDLPDAAFDRFILISSRKRTSIPC